MNIKEEFIFGDLSSLDLKNCEEISINAPCIESSKKMKAIESSSNKDFPPTAPPKIALLNNNIVSSADPNAILTVKQASEYLQVRTETILRKIYAGELSAFKVGRIWRIKQAQIDNYLNQNISENGIKPK